MNDMKWAVIGFIVFILAVFGGLAFDSYQKELTKRACIAAPSGCSLKESKE
jgi:hypothetical protein